jgi:hypothetical protein
MSTINAGTTVPTALTLTGDTSGTLSLATGGTTRMTVTETGQVGIGTTAPTINTNGTVLHINNSTASNGAIVHFTTAATGAASNDGLIVGKWSDNTNYFYDYDNYPIAFGTNSVERMRIAAAGQITMPYQPCFSAYGGGTQSWSGAAARQIVQLNSTLINRGSHYNTSTYTFTAPVAGAYLFIGKITQTTTATGPNAEIWKNGSYVTEISIAYTTAYMTAAGSVILDLAANDAITFRVINFNDTSLTLDLGRTGFTGVFLG